MSVRSTIENQGKNGPGTRSILADAVADVDPTQCRPGDRLEELDTGAVYDLSDRGGTLSWALSSGSGTLPTTLHYYVSLTGNNGLKHSGSISDPLRTVAEALRRIGVALYSDLAIVTVMDDVTEGANPRWAVPSPIGGATPVLIQTTYVTAVAGIAVTGGTQGSLATSTPATLTSADGSAANARRGEIAALSGPTIGGTRYVIDSNDGVGGFTLPVFLAGVPAVGNTLDILHRAGTISWSGELVCDCPGGVYLDGVEMIPTGAGASFLKLGSLIETATKWTAPAAGSFCIRQSGGDWQSGAAISPGPFSPTSASVGPVPLPTGVTPCGCRYDGALAAMQIGVNGTAGPYIPCAWTFDVFSAQGVDFSPAGKGHYMLLQGNGQMLTCGVFAGFHGRIDLSAVGITSGRTVSWFAAAAVIAVQTFAEAIIANVRFTTPAVADDCIAITAYGSASVAGCNGAAGAAGKLFLRVDTGGRVRFPSANTATGGTVGTDIAVDGGVGFAVALLATLGAFGAPQGGFQHSTDNSAAPGATTINKLAGKAAVAAGAGNVTVTNSLCAVGDSVQITPMDIDATGVTYKAVAGAGSFVVTLGAGPTANWRFQFLVTKATV